MMGDFNIAEFERLEEEGSEPSGAEVDQPRKSTGGRKSIGTGVASRKSIGKSRKSVGNSRKRSDSDSNEAPVQRAVKKQKRKPKAKKPLKTTDDESDTTEDDSDDANFG